MTLGRCLSRIFCSRLTPASNPESINEFLLRPCPKPGSGLLKCAVVNREQNGRDTGHPAPCTLHPTPYTLHSLPYTLHLAPYTLHPAPYTLHPTPCTLHPAPCIPDTTGSPFVGDRLDVSDARESGREKWLLSAKRSAPEASRRAFKGVVTALISFTCSKEGGHRGS